jgi:ubiquitin thioesterase protein OTUB1
MGLRRIRSDGNCFYRSFIFGYFEYLLGARSEELERAIKIVDESKAALMEHGFDEMSIDVFWENFLEQLRSLPRKSIADLEREFSEFGDSNYLVWYARAITAWFMKANADRFAPFVEGMSPGMTVDRFCAEEVLPMDRDCEQLQIIALTEALQVRIRIEYLDGATSIGGSLTHHDFPESDGAGGVAAPLFVLLYKPGHYELLYPKSAAGQLPETNN